MSHDVTPTVGGCIKVKFWVSDSHTAESNLDGGEGRETERRDGYDTYIPPSVEFLNNVKDIKGRWSAAAAPFNISRMKGEKKEEKPDRFSVEHER